jgi:hypothetical protein
VESQQRSPWHSQQRSKRGAHAQLQPDQTALQLIEGRLVGLTPHSTSPAPPPPPSGPFQHNGATNKSTTNDCSALVMPCALTAAILLKSWIERLPLCRRKTL